MVKPRFLQFVAACAVAGPLMFLAGTASAQTLPASETCNNYLTPFTSGFANNYHMNNASLAAGEVFTLQSDIVRAGTFTFEIVGGPSGTVAFGESVSLVVPSTGTFSLHILTSDAGAINATMSCVAANDADDDGVADAIDNCPVVANADQANANQDEEGDACEGSLAEPTGSESAPLAWSALVVTLVGCGSLALSRRRVA